MKRNQTNQFIETKLSRMKTLVENQTVFSLEDAELSIYETVQKAEGVAFYFERPNIAMMLNGKKVLSFPNGEKFDYTPGNVFITPPHTTILADIPEASYDNPTVCLTLDVSEAYLNKILLKLKEKQLKLEEENDRHRELPASFYITDDASICQSLERLTHVFVEEHQAKNLLADLTLQELIVRLMQSHVRTLLIENSKDYALDFRLSHVVEHIKANLSEKLTIDELANLACTSKATFHRLFKNAFGITTVEFIHQERVKRAKELLLDPNATLTDVCYASGFQSLNNFIKTFRTVAGTTPKSFQKAQLAS